MATGCGVDKVSAGIDSGEDSGRLSDEEQPWSPGSYEASDESGGGASIPGWDDSPGTFRLVPTVAVVQRVVPGNAVSSVPGVRVMNEDDEPMAGVEVVFELAAGQAGYLARDSVMSDANGFASAGRWSVGNLVGDYTLNASVPEFEAIEPLPFIARAATDYHIELVFTTDPTPEQYAVFDKARRRWEGVILNALPAVEGSLADYAESCGYVVEDRWVHTEGLTLFIELGPIDGPNKTLGRAGPCLLRAADNSPVFGGMTLDTADLDLLQSRGYLESVILHEMGHVLGIGTVWGHLDLLANPSIPDADGADTHFRGDHAKVAFEGLLGAFDYTDGQIVPVANQGVRGSSDGHWREDVLGNELMTPTLTGRESALPLSMLTIASLADLGFYETNARVADPFVLPYKQATLQTQDFANEPSLMDGCSLMEPKFVVAGVD